MRISSIPVPCFSLTASQRFFHGVEFIHGLNSGERERYVCDLGDYELVAGCDRLLHEYALVRGRQSLHSVDTYESYGAGARNGTLDRYLHPARRVDAFPRDLIN